MVLARKLAHELEALGLVDVVLRDSAILTATLPANVDHAVPVVSFFAHLDTSAEQPADTRAQIIGYQGGDITLNAEHNIVLRAAEFPELDNYIGQEIITTDGTSLLGADDKAAIAAIIDALQYLQENPSIPMRSKVCAAVRHLMWQRSVPTLATHLTVVVSANLSAKTGTLATQY